MKNWIFASLVSFASFAVISPAFATLQIGTYVGSLPNGDGCSVQVISVSFEGGVRHPLNERAKIEFQGTEYILSHPSIIDEATGTVTFSHDDLRTVIPFTGGASAVLLKMDHSEGRDGPSELVIMRHDYRNRANNSKQVCGGLQFSANKQLSREIPEPVQYIDCSDLDPWSDEKVIISLRASGENTLFISSGITAPEPNNSGVLPLQFVETQSSGQTRYRSSNSVASFEVLLPTAILGRRSDSFAMRLTGQLNDGSFRHDEEFVCFTRMY